MPVDQSASFTFDKFWQKQKDNVDSLMDNFQYKLSARWGEVIHMSSIMNKWVQRAAEGTKLAAGMQEFLVGIQIAQMGVATTMLGIQAVAAFAGGHIAYGVYLSALAADMSFEMIFLISTKEAAKQAKIESAAQGEAVKNWRMSYN